MPDPNDFNAKVIEEFPANGGKVGGMFEGAPLMLLHSTGAKSGAERVHPIMYQALDDDYAVFASYAGGPANPAWFHNLVANPEATVEVGTERIAVTARVTQGDEREQIWSRQKERFSQFAEYEQKTSREIPVVVLERGD